MLSRSFKIALVLLALALSVSACGSSGKPVIVISSPPHGSQFETGADVTVQSVATDPSGIARVELLVDGEVVRTDTAPTTQTQGTFNVIQIWKATDGTHAISVRATSKTNAVSDPAVISVSVLSAPVPPTVAVYATPPPPPAFPTPAPSIVPLQLPPAPLATTSACVDNVVFVADVTVPDGSVMTPGQSFSKVWRVKNTGTCAWQAGYQFAFANGDTMATVAAVAVANTPPGATADLQVAMTAPATAGAYAGQWRLRNAAQVPFGPALYVSIKVGDSSAPTVPAAPTGAASSVPGPTSALRVSGVAARADTTNCVSPSYETILTGEITASRDGEITYQWEGDGLTPSVKTAQFGVAGTKTIVGPTHTGKGSFTATLHVTKPNDQSASVTYSCK